MWEMENEGRVEEHQRVFAEVLRERARQDAKWGGAEHDDGHSTGDWLRFITEHTTRAQIIRSDRVSPDTREGMQVAFRRHFIRQVIRVAALCFAALTSIRRQYPVDWKAATETMEG